MSGIVAATLLGVTALGPSAWAYLRPSGQDAAGPVAATKVAPASATTTVVIVRHAERGNNDPADPSLSPEGQVRAEALVTALDGAEIGAIYSTPFKRTQESVQPLSKRFKIPVTTRPISGNNIPAYAEQFAKEILAKDAGKTVVIVGHSNTVPELVKAFSGRSVPAYSEDEYDRFYVIVRPAGTEPARLFQTRYGKSAGKTAP
jgi:phosphohistidine phosphatase SixA